MGNPFVHIELSTSDVDKARQFYSNLFSWKLQDMPKYDYVGIDVGDGVGGGMMKNPDPGACSQWLPYVKVDDVAAATRKAQSLGATILKEPTEIPDYGWYSMFEDPTGARLALWQTKPGM